LRNKSVRLLNLFFQSFLDVQMLRIVKHLIKLFLNYYSYKNPDLHAVYVIRVITDARERSRPFRVCLTAWSHECGVAAGFRIIVPTKHLVDLIIVKPMTA
jgi:hypothetical protein